MAKTTPKRLAGLKADHIKARDLMTTEVLTIASDSTVAELSAFLLQHEITGAVVLDSENELAGVVSMSDITEHVKKRADITARGRSDYYVRGWQDDFEPLDLLEFHIEDSELRVRDILNPQVYVVSEDTEISAVADMMLNGRLHRILVTKGRDLVGIISTSDFLKLFVREERVHQSSSSEASMEAVQGAAAEI